MYSGSAKSSSSGQPRSLLGLSFVFGFAFAFLFAIGGVFLYLRYGHPPVAVADAPFPQEGQVTHIPLSARIGRELATAPMTPGTADFIAGAQVYVKQCSVCHGTPAQESPIAKQMFPAAPQLWKKHGHSDVVGVSDDEPGETYWKVANGIRLSGMPAFNHLLNQTEMWQVSLLLKHADQPLDPQVASVLRTPLQP